MTPPGGSQPTPSTAPASSGWTPFGAAILLLLIWHASAIPVLLGLPMPDAIRLANAFFLPYRMPTLMFLSGMLLARTLASRSPTTTPARSR